MSQEVLYTLGAVVLVSLLSLVGACVFLCWNKGVKKGLLYFVSFSAGALLGDVFIHIIPEIAEDENFLEQGLLILLAGIVLSFVIEKVIHWQHCHDLDCEDHIQPVGKMNLIGDALHNFIDGMLIAGSFLVSIPLGIATTVAVALHEIPQEIGDFAILLYSGFSKKKAMLFNILSALAAVLGALIILVTSKEMPQLTSYVLAFTAGNFVYIASTDLIPELHKESRLPQASLQLLCLVGGIVVMYGLTLFE